MTSDELLEDTAEELFENAPCGYLSTRLDGTIIKVNRTFETWTGHQRETLLGARRFQDLLAPGGRIYYDTHIAPLLVMQGSVREIAVELVRPDGTRLPALVNSTLREDPEGRPQVVRVTVFDASDRRRYEQELLRARRQEEEVARRLQRSLLSGDLPEHEALELHVAYRPGVSGLEVGGDWYDAFWVSEGERVALVVGDVVGRGIEAAATMGQLRSAVRALASTGMAPGDLLTALDEFARRHAVGRMTTLIYAELDLTTRRLCFACAGHPPPVLVGAGGDAELPMEGRSLPLDAHHVAGRARAQGERPLEPGGAVLLYTDGLVERRGTGLDERLALLTATVGRHAGGDPARLADALLRDLPGGEHRDDVCLLFARVP